jgi:hypothetical protein
MQFQQAPTQMRGVNRASPENSTPVNAEPSIKEIPYDYVATFKLLGNPGNRVQDVVNISVEGAFVAVAVGYSFIPATALPLPEIPSTTPTDGVITAAPAPSASNTTLVRLIAARVANALRIPSSTDSQKAASQLATVIQPFVEPRELLQCLQLKLCGIHFKYSIVDSGSGRELQNQPIHNIAGLGEASGDRPFRPFAKPMVFMPRSTIRIEIEEISQGAIYEGATLYIVLHGYKMLGYGTGLP